MRRMLHVPLVTHVPPMETSKGLHDIALGLQNDRHAFYVRAKSAERGSVKMDIPKLALRPPIQPPGLFHLLACGLLKFNLESGKFHAFCSLIIGYKQTQGNTQGRLKI